VPSPSPLVLLKLILAGAAFGLTALLFITCTKQIRAFFSRILPYPPLRSAVGGLVIIALVYLLGTRDYLGLGLPLMQQAFTEAASPIIFLLKTLFTSITLGTGFQGGEVTPLFIIGSTLGSALGGLLDLSVPLLAAVGLAAVFSGAAKTPIACFIMGI